MTNPDSRITSELHVDVAIIGAGTAGLAAYRAAKAAGTRALLIEGGPYGTTCARVGCMPSKLLIAPAEAAHAVDRFARVRPHAGRPRQRRRQGGDGTGAQRARSFRRLCHARRGRDSRRRQGARATRDSWTTTRWSWTSGVTVHATSIVIATGSSPAYPGGLEGARRPADHQRRRIRTRPTFPESVAVFGPGVIGLELGQALHRLGVRVKVFGRGGGVGPLSDPALAARSQGRLRRGVLPRHRRACGSGARRRRRRGQLSRAGWFRAGRALRLPARGHRPHRQRRADWSSSGPRSPRDARGVPLFDRNTLRCGDSSIFIAGDVNNDVPLLHEAADEGRIAGENAATISGRASPACAAHC